jgi:hypothetical protein
MNRLLARATIIVFLLAGSVEAQNLTYQGQWHTTNRKLDGVMTCVVKSTGKHQWQGRFYGIWQGVTFDYTDEFVGPANNLRGTAAIDGAHYEWKGSMTRERFRANFGGDRYAGTFDLARVKTKDGQLSSTRRQ